MSLSRLDFLNCTMVSRDSCVSFASWVVKFAILILYEYISPCKRTQSTHSIFLCAGVGVGISDLIIWGDIFSITGVMRDIIHRQIGHVLFRLYHDLMHLLWYWWLHGINVTLPSVIEYLHITHSVCDDSFFSVSGGDCGGASSLRIGVGALGAGSAGALGAGSAVLAPRTYPHCGHAWLRETFHWRKHESWNTWPHWRRRTSLSPRSNESRQMLHGIAWDMTFRGPLFSR